MNIILCGYHWSGCEALNYLLKKKNKVFVYTHKSRYFEPDLEEYCKDKKVRFSLKISIKLTFYSGFNYKHFL